MAKILVTGAAGFIGSHVVHYLDKQGFETVALDNLELGNRSSIAPHVKFYGCDLRDATSVKNVVATEKPDAVVHLAAYAQVGESFEKAHEYTMNNVGGMLNLVGAMILAGVEKIVFSSSCSVYGNSTGGAMDELTPIAPISPYGKTKQDCEQILKNAKGLRYVTLRLFNVAGGDFQVKTPRSESRIISRALQAAEGRGFLTVFDDNHLTKDGTTIRDYVHVNDVCRAIEKALEYLNFGGLSDEFNIGSGEGHSIKEVIATVEEVTGREVSYIFAGRQEGDPSEVVAFCSKARSVLGWKPACSDLYEIVFDTWKAPVSV